jgi:hypothetical protein
MIMVVVMTSEEVTSEEGTSELGCVSIYLIVLLFFSIGLLLGWTSGYGTGPCTARGTYRRSGIGRDLGALLLFRLNSSSHLSAFGSSFMSHEQLQLILYHTISHETMTRYHVKNGQYKEVMIFYPRLRAGPLVSRPVEPAWAALLVVGLGPPVPAIQLARSNPPPAMALEVAPVMGEERECCSNSARISGSTRQQG